MVGDFAGQPGVAVHTNGVCGGDDEERVDIEVDPYNRDGLRRDCHDPVLGVVICSDGISAWVWVRSILASRNHPTYCRLWNDHPETPLLHWRICDRIVRAEGAPPATNARGRVPRATFGGDVDSGGGAHADQSRVDIEVDPYGGDVVGSAYRRVRADHPTSVGVCVYGDGGVVGHDTRGSGWVDAWVDPYHDDHGYFRTRGAMCTSDCGVAGGVFRGDDVRGGERVDIEVDPYSRDDHRRNRIGRCIAGGIYRAIHEGAHADWIAPADHPRPDRSAVNRICRNAF